MPQTKTTRVAVMFENLSLVCEAKRDAGFMLAVVSVFSGCVLFVESSAWLSVVVARLIRRGSVSISRRANALAVLLLSGSGTIRSLGKAQFVVLARLAFLPALRIKSWLVFAGLLRASLQSKHSLFELAPTIVWLVPSLQRAGITSRSTGLPSAAR